jgi:putative FmdB family regulatory protein
MPIYEYKCKECGHVFEAFQRIGADGSNLTCPVCNSKKPEKIFSAFASSGGDFTSGSFGGSSCGSGGFS